MIVKPEALLVYITCPDEAAARELGELLVVEGLAACANILPRLASIYCWKEKLQRDDEALLLVKTTAQRLEELTERAVELHPYELPCVVALPIAGGHRPYLDWITEQTDPDESRAETRSQPPPGGYS